MKKRIAIIAVAVVVAVAGLLGVLFTRRPLPEPSAAAPTAEKSTGTVTFLMEQQWLIRMKLAKAESSSLARQITATGRVIAAANHQAVVAPPVGGIILSGLRGQLPRIGQSVSAGQTIATLRQTATSAEQAQVRAATAQAESQNAQVALDAARLEAERRTADGEIESTRARLELARREAERATKLFEQGILSRQQLDIAEAELKFAQANFGAVTARRKALDAADKIKPVNIGSDNTGGAYLARAPISGIVTKVNKNIGEQVAPGEAIIEIVNLETVWVEAPIFERDLARLGNRTRAVFTTSAAPETEFSGSIVNIGAVVDEQSRAATVIFEVPNKGRALRIGMQANVRLDAGERVEAVIVPKEAVLEHEGKKIVYVLLSGEEFERREVQLGDEYSGKVAVLAGLKAGERVVTQGAYQLKLQELRPADAGAHSHET
jgi:cobalt-zinc-cadmium efflux system membrane fusion protein